MNHNIKKYNFLNKVESINPLPWIENNNNLIGMGVVFNVVVKKFRFKNKYCNKILKEIIAMLIKRW